LLDRYTPLVMQVAVNLAPGGEVAVRALIDHAHVGASRRPAAERFRP
jgi:hypothetical protein